MILSENTKKSINLSLKQYKEGGYRLFESKK